MDVKIYSSQDFPNYLPKLNLLYDDLFTGGKGFRAKLSKMVADSIQLPSSATQLLAQTIEFIHNASLLHDDLVDRSHLRRGKPSAWLKYTPEYAVLAGDYLLARVMVNLSEFGNLSLVQYTSQVISDLLEGEWLQDSLVGDMKVEMSSLDRVHNLKTASLFKWCLRAPFLAKKNSDPVIHESLEEMGTILGQLFQRSDDLLDFDVRNYEKKAILSDLKSGYLNSFAAFALDQKSRPELSQCQTLTFDEFVFMMGGPQLFDQAVKSFDEINARLIQIYHHRLQSLGERLHPTEKGLIRTLEPLTDVLYWRKSKE